MHYDLTLSESAFPIFFVGMWLFVTTVLGFSSGAFGLRRVYGSNRERPLLTLWSQSGELGLVRINGALVLSACRSGLRVGIWRIFGPFQCPFLVPWDEIAATDSPAIIGRRTRLDFGVPLIGSLVISTGAWDRLLAAQRTV